MLRGCTGGGTLFFRLRPASRCRPPSSLSTPFSPPPASPSASEAWVGLPLLRPAPFCSSLSFSRCSLVRSWLGVGLGLGQGWGWVWGWG